jgi:hypothetical protein
VNYPVYSLSSEEFNAGFQNVRSNPKKVSVYRKTAESERKLDHFSSLCIANVQILKILAGT